MRYYVNNKAQSNGDHEVHADNCSWLPSVENRRYLGDFTGCSQAVLEALKYHRQVNGCYHCSFFCHTQ